MTVVGDMCSLGRGRVNVKNETVLGHATRPRVGVEVSMLSNLSSVHYGTL